MVKTNVAFTEAQQLNRAMDKIGIPNPKKYDYEIDDDEENWAVMKVTRKNSSDDENETLFHLTYYLEPEADDDSNPTGDNWVIDEFEHEDEEEMLEVLNAIGVIEVGVNLEHDDCDRDWGQQDNADENEESDGEREGEDD